MTSPWPLLILMSCHKAEPDPVETDPGPCALETTQYATNEATRTRHPACGEAVLDVFLPLGEGTLSVELFTDGQRVIPALTARGGDAVFRGLHMKGRWLVEGEGPTRVWGQGYTSDADPGVLDSGAVQSGSDGLPVAGSAGTSWWAGMAGRAQGPAVLVGAHSALQTSFRVAFDADGTLHAVWGGQGEEIAVREGMLLYLDPLYMAVGPDPAELWGAWADTVAEGAAVGFSAEPPPVAWRVEPATEGDVTQILVDLAAPEAAVVASLIVGDGWSDGWDLAALAAEIEAAGFVPGLRITPFHVDRGSPVHAANPDWWVLDASGAEIDDGGRALLDAGNADAMDWLQDQIELRSSEGWRVLELGELEAGALEATRAGALPGSVAYRRGLERIRQAAPDAWLVATEAPQLPSLGLVDAWRAGPTSWWANGRWWWNDPGPIAADGLAPEQARGTVVRAVVIGGVWTGAGDPEGAAELVLHPDAIAARTGLATPSAGLASTGLPTVWDLSDGSVALTNLGDAPVEVDGPGGVEVLTGEQTAAGPRQLDPGTGEIWR